MNDQNKRIRTLMFGWEFPPHISGGLGTACYGLTMGLAKHGLDILFVVPKAYGDENEDALKLLNASAVTLDLMTSNTGNTGAAYNTWRLGQISFRMLVRRITAGSWKMRIEQRPLPVMYFQRNIFFQVDMDLICWKK